MGGPPSKRLARLGLVGVATVGASDPAERAGLMIEALLHGISRNAGGRATGRKGPPKIMERPRLQPGRPVFTLAAHLVRHRLVDPTLRGRDPRHR